MENYTATEIGPKSAPGRLLSIKDIQELFGRSRTWVWKMRKEGKIKPSPIDSHRFSFEEIQRLTRG